jgi:hypothetical protein
LHGIGDPRDHNGDRGRGLFGRLGCRGIHRQDDVNLEPQEFVCQRAEPLVFPLRIPQFERDVFPFDVPKLAEPLPEGFEEPRGRAVVHENANAVYLRRWLRLSDDRCSEQGNNKDDRFLYHFSPDSRRCRT